MAVIRPLDARVFAGLVLAAVSGLAIGWMDSRPGFDATGVTVVALLIAAASTSFLVSMPERSPIGLAILVALLVGGWVPLLEGNGASLAGLAIAAIGAAVGRTPRAFGTRQ